MILKVLELCWVEMVLNTHPFEGFFQFPLLLELAEFTDLSAYPTKCITNSKILEEKGKLVILDTSRSENCVADEAECYLYQFGHFIFTWIFVLVDKR